MKWVVWLLFSRKNPVYVIEFKNRHVVLVVVFPLYPDPCLQGRKGKRRESEETRAGRHSSDMPRHSEGNHPKYFPPRSTLCVCVWVYDSCFWGQSDKLTDKLSAVEQSLKHTGCVCVWESASENVKVRIIESGLVGETERWGGGKGCTMHVF